MYDLMNSRDAPTVLERIEALLGYLDELRERFKSAVARLVGRSAAGAAADFIRLLLGQSPASRVEENEDQYYRPEDDPWGEPYEAHPRMAYDSTTSADPPATPLAWTAGWLLALLSWIAPLASWAGVLLA